MINNPPIILEKVGVRLGGLSILSEVDLSIGAGEFIVVLGPNGAGKTTLLKLLLGLIRPSAGSASSAGPHTPTRQSGHRLCAAASDHRAGNAHPGARPGRFRPGRTPMGHWLADPQSS